VSDRPFPFSTLKKFVSPQTFFFGAVRLCEQTADCLECRRTVTRRVGGWGAGGGVRGGAAVPAGLADTFPGFFNASKEMAN